MGRKRKGRFKYSDDLPPEFVLGVLKLRALHRSAERKHKLGTWIAAKKQHGKAAQVSSCQTCHAKVVIMPHGPRESWGVSHVEGGEVSRRGTPSMRGEAVFEVCQ